MFRVTEDSLYFNSLLLDEQTHCEKAAPQPFGEGGREGESERAQVHAGGEPASRGATAAKGNIRQDADKNSLQETNFVDLVPTLSSGGYGWSLLASSMAVVANAGCR